MLKKRIIKGIILIILCLIVYFATSGICNAETEYVETYKKAGFSGDGTYNGGLSLQYVNYFNYEGSSQEYMFFCNKLGYPPILINRALGSEWSQGSPDISVSEGTYKRDEINPQIAYALSIGVLPANMSDRNGKPGDATSWEYLQNLIWDAKMDEGEDNGLLNPDSDYNPDLQSVTPIEVNRFRKVYEEIFEKTIGLSDPIPVFKIIDKQASLYVDQNDGTYIYGPFQLKVNVEDASQEAIDNLRREIMQEGHEEYIDYVDDDFEASEAYIENFYKFHKSLDECFITNGISDGSKKLLRYDTVSTNKDKNNMYSTIIVDKNEKPIDFPALSTDDSDDNNFFIKFYPAKGGSIINLGNADEGAKLFELKIKYGTYVNYKEHYQISKFYTKGVMGYLYESDLADNLVIKKGYNLRTFPGNNVRVEWKRIDDNSENPVRWWSYLESIKGPSKCAIYDNNTSSFLVIDNRKALIHREVPDGAVPGTSYVSLNDYYSDIKCTGFSKTNMGSGASQYGSRIRIPFDFAGSSEVEVDRAVETIKDNYPFPLTQKLEFINFHGIVQEQATRTYTAKRYVKEDDEPEYEEDENGNQVQTNKGAWHWSYDGVWKREQTITRYVYKTITADDIKTYAAQNKIKPNKTTPRPAGTDDWTDIGTPSNDGNDYRNYSYTTTDWTVTEIYGAKTNTETTFDNIDTDTVYGFRYKTVEEGWYLDTDFKFYDDRIVLAAALDLIHQYTYKPGEATGEYDVWIPRDMAAMASEIDSWQEAEYYQMLQGEINKIKNEMQTYISFESEEGDIFKFGTRIHIEAVALPHLKIAEAFGGNVWKETVDVKTPAESGIDGIYDSKNEEAYSGVKVDLYECDIEYQPPQRGLKITDANVKEGHYLTSTFTDSKGNYRFYGYTTDTNTPLINPLKKYYVKFVYNGQIYAQTLYNVEIDAASHYDPDTKTNYGRYADFTSKGMDEYRKEFNKRFENIYADSNNYTYSGKRYTGYSGETTHTGRAYGLKHAVKEALDGVANDPSANPALDTFEEQYNLFVYNNTHEDFIDGTSDYQFKHAGGTRLDEPIDHEGGEIVSSNIDKKWEHEVGQLIDFNYNGLSESVKNYLQDCMIEASVPYTPDLEVYGKNVGTTDLHKKFPQEATFNLKDMSRVCLDRYKKWTLIAGRKKVPLNAPDYFDVEIPDAIKAYVDKHAPEGTEVTLYVFEGEEYVHIEWGKGSGSVDIKVASLTDNYNIDFGESTTKVAGQINNTVPRNNTTNGEPVGPDEPPDQTWKWAYGLIWDLYVYEEIHIIDHHYEPPEEHYINLYNKEFDLRHCWSFGVYQRNYNEVSLAKDLYKVTMVVNGKKEVYSYSGQVKNEDCGQYNIVGNGEYAGVAKIERPLNGGDSYVRKVRKSDYLYDEDLAYGNNEHDKNIQAYLTYKISIQNTGPYTVRINEIADYYDSDNLEFDGVRNENGELITDSNNKYQIATHTQNIDGQITTSKYTYASNTLDDAGHDPNTEYIGVYSKSAYANGGNNDESFAIANNDTDNEGKPYRLETLYIRGNDNGKDAGVPSITYKRATKEERPMYELLPGQYATVFLAFKVKNNSLEKGITKFANQIKLDQISPDFINELATVGKNNFAEINSYASYYTSQMPGDAPNTVEKTYYRPYGEGKIKYGNGKAVYLDMHDHEVGVETDPDICIAGVVDVYSNPGSFTERDVEVVYNEGGKYKDIQFKDFSYIKITRPKSTKDRFYPRVNKNDPDEEALLPYEPDTAKAPTIRFILDDQEIRKISGLVFEDNRNVTSDGSPIGDGEIGAGDTPIDGVTVQLVELIQDVDYDGTFTGQYIGEKVWEEYEYSGNQNYDSIYGNEKDEYYSGKGVVKYILNAPQELTMIHKDTEELNGDAIGSGRYCFAGIPSGDFVIRFLYGDTTRTALTNGTTNKDVDGNVIETATVNALVGANGYNVKSYNGQDYKSTVYQRKLNSNSSTDYQVNQEEISYNMKDSNAVKGYIDTQNQDYASTWNYYKYDETNQNYSLRDKSEFYNGEVYSVGQPINNNGNLQVSGNVQGVAPRNNINNSYGSMWRYDRIATNDKPLLSDANDLYGYRQRGIDYAQGYTTGVSQEEKTLMNYRAEVLSSFERVTSQEDETGAPRADVQKAMLNEFIENTYMVAQSGIISMNHEYEGLNDNDKNISHGNTDDSTKLHMVTGGITHENHARNVDLGLVERPRSQVKLTKEVSNLEIKLADGQTLFNSNTQMKDLIFDEHVGHEINYDKPNVGPILESVRVKLRSQTAPEFVQATMDDEIMDGATINVTYHLQVENVGEVDYLDRDFYYYGRKSGTVTEPVRTKVVRVIDYVANDLSYDSSKQNADAKWEVYTPSDLIRSRITIDSNNNNKIDNTIPGANYFVDEVEVTKNGFINRIQSRDGNVTSPEGKFYDKMNRDYVTRTYANEVATYNTVVVTKDLNDPLLPTVYVKGKDTLANQNIDKTTLILTTTITASGNSEDLTYNNLAEVIETSNLYGRRMQFSIAGNQEMANQDINDGGRGDNEAQDHHGHSASKITQPKEIDADSAQQVVILPPTGSPEYRNKVLTIITTAIATIIVLVGAVIIKKKVYDK